MGVRFSRGKPVNNAENLDFMQVFGFSFFRPQVERPFIFISKGRDIGNKVTSNIATTNAEFLLKKISEKIVILLMKITTLLMRAFA